jgi:hypothetical protein
MSDLTRVLKSPKFRWLPKHLNHIAENIVFKRRNISFLAINALFKQQKTYEIEKDKGGFIGSYTVRDFVVSQPNDQLRTREEWLEVAFYINSHGNVIVTTAYSENDAHQS